MGARHSPAWAKIASLAAAPGSASEPAWPARYCHGLKRAARALRWGSHPATIAITIFADQLARGLEDPSGINYWLVAGVLIFFILLIVVARRWLGILQA